MSLKEELEQIERQAEEKRRRQNAASEEYRQKMDALEQKFERVKESVIRPALTEALDFLLSQNHGAILETHPHALALTFCRENTLEPLQIKSSPTSNFIIFGFNKDTLKLEVECAKTLPKNSPPQRPFTQPFSASLTREVVDKIVEDAVRAVIL